MRRRWTLVAARAAVLAIALATLLAGCSGGSGSSHSAPDSSSASPTPTPTASVPGAQTSVLSAGQAAQASSWATGYLAALIADHPELTGLTIEGLYPVFDQGGAAPVAVMARMAAPKAIASVDLDLIRFKDGAPELLPSRVENLRVLEAIYRFDTSTVIHLDISPLPADGADPATATRVIPLPGQQKTDDRFGGTD
jgi:hypothetical protein